MIYDLRGGLLHQLGGENDVTCSFVKTFSRRTNKEKRGAGHARTHVIFTTRKRRPTFFIIINK